MAKKLKVVHLTSVHDASDVRIFHKECRTLADAGYEVVLVVPAEKNGSHSGVRIHHIPEPKGRLKRVTQTVGQVYLAALSERASIYHFHDPELIPVGLLLKLAGKRVVYDVHEDVPRQILNKHWISLRLRKIVAKGTEVLEMVVGRIFDQIIAATPTIARRFPSSKSMTVHNFPQVTEFENVPVPYSKRPFVVTYVGEISENRGVREMVAAVSLLATESPAKLVLAGTFSSSELEDQVKTMNGWNRIEFVRRQERAGIIRLLTRSRVGLAVLHPYPNYLESYPIKLFEYMAAGIPVVASNFPLWRQIIEAEGCGFLVDPLKPEKIAKAIEWLLNHPEQAEKMGNAGRKAVFSKYNWRHEAEKLTQAYSTLAQV